MRKSIFIIFAAAALILFFGVVLASISAVPQIIPTLLFAVAGSLTAILIATRGGTVIRDEMVRRADVLAGYYTSTVTLYFIFTCGIINFFIPLPLSVSGLLLLLMFVMSISFVLIRFVLLRRGVSE